MSSERLHIPPTVIASVYIRFSVAHGRGMLIAVETAWLLLVVIAAVALTGSAWRPPPDQRATV